MCVCVCVCMCAYIYCLCAFLNITIQEISPISNNASSIPYIYIIMQIHNSYI